MGDTDIKGIGGRGGRRGGGREGRVGREESEDVRTDGREVRWFDLRDATVRLDDRRKEMLDAIVADTSQVLEEGTEKVKGSSRKKENQRKSRRLEGRRRAGERDGGGRQGKTPWKRGRGMG